MYHMGFAWLASKLCFKRGLKDMSEVYSVQKDIGSHHTILMSKYYQQSNLQAIQDILQDFSSGGFPS